MPEKKVKENIRDLIEGAREKVFVETDTTDKVIGYIHLAPYELLYFKPLVNILALLVDEKYRRTGIGRKLVWEAKKWALKNKFYGLRVISGNGKETAPAFYKALGFIFIKSQGNFQIKFDKER